MAARVDTTAAAAIELHLTILADELKTAGFAAAEIDQAVRWMARHNVGTLATVRSDVTTAINAMVAPTGVEPVEPIAGHVG